MSEAAEPRTKEAIEQDVIATLKTVYDPEIPVDIYQLGLIYNIDVRDDRSVEVRLTLTSPMCPVAESLPPEVEAKVAQVDGVTKSIVDLVWDPPWNPGMMSEAAKLELGMM
jgi:FeS assembly SUF system protein